MDDKKGLAGLPPSHPLNALTPAQWRVIGTLAAGDKLPAATATADTAALEARGLVEPVAGEWRLTRLGLVLAALLFPSPEGDECAALAEYRAVLRSEGYTTDNGR